MTCATIMFAVGFKLVLFGGIYLSVTAWRRVFNRKG